MDTRDVHPLTDFLRNHKAHMARIRESKRAEILTVHGRAELAVLDAESYQNLLDRLHHMEAISAIRADFARVRQPVPLPEEISEAEMDRRKSVMHELMAETERLGLYK
jgi:hypothetical protein